MINLLIPSVISEEFWFFETPKIGGKWQGSAEEKETTFASIELTGSSKNWRLEKLGLNNILWFKIVQQTVHETHMWNLLSDPVISTKAVMLLSIDEIQWTLLENIDF